MNRKITYQQVTADYFYEFVRGANKESISMWLFQIPFYMYILSQLDRINGLPCVVPFFFAMISADLHRLTLPYMMYFIPYSLKERECYLQKMLHVKVLLPVAVCLVWDSIWVFGDSLSGYALVLQVLSVFGVTYLWGMLKDGSVQDAEEKKAFGSMKGYVGAVLIANLIAAAVILVVCTGEVSRLEFQIILGILLLVLLPSIIMTRKHWPDIRSNFANYEMVMETEVKKCRS